MLRYVKKMLAIALLFSIAGCIESSFVLSPDSRIPRWFVEPTGTHEFKVTLDYHTNGDAVFKLFEKESERHIITITGVTQSKKPLKLKVTPPGFPKHYPMYEIITANGITEIIEHRKMEPIFHVVDDPSIYKEFGVWVTNNK